MQQRYFLELSYRGTNFHGWQRQNNAMSVQETLETALSKVQKIETGLLGCGRTYTGVHASQYFAHFDAQEPLSTNFLPHLNSLVAPDIFVSKVHAVHEQAHARFDARQRAYNYFLHLQYDPFLRGLSTEYVHHALDFDRMNEAAQLLLKFTDFAGYQKTGSGSKTSICRLDHAQWQPAQSVIPTGSKTECWVFQIVADRFLRGMVRLIVGSLLEVGRGRVSLEQFEETVAARKRFDRMTAAPPDGLYLSRIHYPYLNPPA